MDRYVTERQKQDWKPLLDEIPEWIPNVPDNMQELNTECSSIMREGFYQADKMIERMDALHKEHIFRLKMNPFTALHASSRSEIVARELNFLASEQSLQLVIEKFYIHSFKSLVVILTFLVTRSPVPVNKVVVKFYDLRVEAEYAALDCQSF